MNKGNVLLGMLAGVAAGALLGVLFAPNKGSDTRKKISRKGEDLTDELKSKFDEFLEVLTEKAGTVMDEGKELLNNGKGKFEEVMHDAETASAKR